MSAETSSAGAGGLPRDTRGGDETAGVGSTPYLTPVARVVIGQRAERATSRSMFASDVEALVAEVRRLTALCESQQAEIARLQTAHSRAADTARAFAAGLQAHP